VGVYPSHSRIIAQKKLPAIVKRTQHQGRKLSENSPKSLKSACYEVWTMTEIKSTSLSIPGSSRRSHQRTGFGGDENPPRFMFTRWGPLIPDLGVSGQASMRRCKIVDQTLEKLMQLYIQQMSQVQRPVLAFLPYSVVEASCTYPQRAYLWRSTYSLASWHTCRYRSRI